MKQINKFINADYLSLTKNQVDWYIANGRYPNSRIIRDSDGILYVIGDQSWNKVHPNMLEIIDELLYKNALSIFGGWSPG